MARQGRSVTVLDPDDRPGQAWRASAGLLAPQIDAMADDPLLQLGVAGREYYRERAGELKDETGIDIELFDQGILRLARGEEEVDRLKASVGWQRQHGHQVDWLDPGEVRADWPAVGELDGGLWAPHDGAVHPVRLVEALRASAERAGARFVTDLAESLECTADRVTGVKAASGRFPTGTVVLAAGAWTGRLEGLPRPISVEPVKGQMIARPWPKGVRQGIVYAGKCYVLPRDGEAWCGATVEHAGFAVQTTETGTNYVAERTAELIPALAGLRVLRAWAGLRPGTPDGLPILGREPSIDGLWYATGHGRNGILLAGISAVILEHLMAGEATFEGVDSLRPDRFWSW